MRLRIQTQSPLPIIKAWFIPDVHSALETVYDLKENLCSKVQALKDAQHEAEDLILLLDDFELLDESPFETAVRDGDLICLKVKVQKRSVKTAVKAIVRREPEIPLERKRKRSSSVDDSSEVSSSSVGKPALKKRVVKRPITPLDTSSESSSSSSSTSSSSSSSSTSSTSSTSSSTSTSTSTSSSYSTSSTSSSPPKPRSFKKLVPARPDLIFGSAKNTIRNTHHVPPGFGKPTTHSRNQRRKKKREFIKAGLSLDPQQPAAPKGSSDANTVPLGQPSKKKPTQTGVNSTNSSSSKAQSATPSSALAVSRRVSQPTSQTGPSSSTVKTPTYASSASASGKRIRLQGDPDVHGSDVALGGEYIPDDTDATASGTPTPAPVYLTRDQVMMGSLRNKNKKKGFKLSMANPIPQKIVFADGGSSTTIVEKSDSNRTPTTGTGHGPCGEEGMIVDVDASTLVPADGPSTSTSTPKTTHSRQPRLIPPSEIQERGELPPNVFVTSVDVEAGMWDTPSTKKRNRKKEKARAEKEHYDDQNEEWYGQDDSLAMDKEESVTLSYSNSDPYASTSTPHGRLSQSANAFDWDKAERIFDKSMAVANIEQLKVAGVVGWKALAINPRTFTPEVLLSTARILRILPPSPTNESEGHTIVINPIARQAENPAALAFGLGRGYEEDAGMESDVDEQDVANGVYYEELVSWSDVLSSGWRILEL